MDSSTQFVGKGTSAGSAGIEVDARLFHEAGRRLVHKYRVHKDPLPHPALPEGVVAKLLSFVSRAMAIARLTHLQISVPSSGASPGEVPNDCFPETDIPAVTTTSRRVTFPPIIQTTMEVRGPPGDRHGFSAGRRMHGSHGRREWTDKTTRDIRNDYLSPPPPPRDSHSFGGHRLIGAWKGIPHTKKYCVVHNTDKSECGRHHPQKGSIS